MFLKERCTMWYGCLSIPPLVWMLTILHRRSFDSIRVCVTDLQVCGLRRIRRSAWTLEVRGR